MARESTSFSVELDHITIEDVRLEVANAENGDNQTSGDQLSAPCRCE